VSAIEKIAELFPAHAEHNDARHLPSFDRNAGYLCGCGEHLGWPVQDEPPEAEEFEPDEVNTTFQRPSSAAGAAAWDKAAAQVQKARQGAYGTWGATGQNQPEGWGRYAEPEEAIFVESEPKLEDTVPEPPDDDDPPEPGDTFLEQLAREHANGPVADEAQTYSVGGAGDGEVEYDSPPMTTDPSVEFLADQRAQEAASLADDPVYDPTQDPEWIRVQAQSDADFIGEQEALNDATAIDYEQTPEEAATDLANADPLPVELGKQPTLFPESTAPEPGTGRGIMPPEGDMDDPVASALPGPLDATEVYTPQDVEMAIVDILARLDRGERFLREQLARLHKADHALTMRNALAIARSDQRAADQRKAEATILCAAELYEQSEASMLVRALRDTMHNLRSQLMGFQTVSKSVGSSLSAPSFRP
jgi:hypothetical protein